MSKLEQLTPNAAVRGILPDGLVTVVSVQWFGSEAVELTYKSANGKVANELLYRHDDLPIVGQTPIRRRLSGIVEPISKPMPKMCAAFKAAYPHREDRK